MRNSIYIIFLFLNNFVWSQSDGRPEFFMTNNSDGDVNLIITYNSAEKSGSADMIVEMNHFWSGEIDSSNFNPEAISKMKIELFDVNNVLIKTYEFNKNTSKFSYTDRLDIYFQEDLFKSSIYSNFLNTKHINISLFDSRNRKQQHKLKIDTLISEIEMFRTNLKILEYEENKNCQEIQFKPLLPKPSLDVMLSGVKRAYLYINNISKTLDEYSIYVGMGSYLESLGLEVIHIYDFSKDFVMPSNYCDDVFVKLDYGYSYSNFMFVSWDFSSPCADSKWSFSTDKTFSSVSGEIPVNQKFKNFLSEFHNVKRNYHLNNRLILSEEMSCWTENKIYNEINNSGYEYIEGIYEIYGKTLEGEKLRLGIKKIKDEYCLIYHSGAVNYENWKDGEVKGFLKPTEIEGEFKVDWIESFKREKSKRLIVFDVNGFNMSSNSKQKDNYIKLFPTQSDNVINKFPQIFSTGTGWALSSNGYIVTNHHVIEGAQEIQIRGIKGDFTKSYSAVVVSDDPVNDITILKISDPKFTSFGTIPYVINTKQPDVGTSIFVLGYPLLAALGEEVKLTNGIISSKTGFQGDPTCYQMSAPVQPGNSGGPLFSSSGNLIGIVNAKYTEGENISYAIKSSYLISQLNSMQDSVSIPTVNLLSGKSFTEQVKMIRNFVFIIEVLE